MKVYDVVVYKVAAYSQHPHPNATNEATKTLDTQTIQQCANMTQKSLHSTDQSQQTSEHILTQKTSIRSAKGKEPYDDLKLNLFVPNSDPEDDDVFINEKLSTPKVCTSMTIALADPLTQTPAWVSVKSRVVGSTALQGSAPNFTSCSQVWLHRNILSMGVPLTLLFDIGLH